MDFSDINISQCDISQISLDETPKVTEELKQDSPKNHKSLPIKILEEDPEKIIQDLHKQNTLEYDGISKKSIAHDSIESILTSKDIKSEKTNNWTIPSNISNWKNATGSYIIPINMRISGNEMNSNKIKPPQKFIELSESLYIAEQKAKEEIASRNCSLKDENISKNNDEQ